MLMIAEERADRIYARFFSESRCGAVISYVIHSVAKMGRGRRHAVEMGNISSLDAAMIDKAERVVNQGSRCVLRLGPYVDKTMGST